MKNLQTTVPTYNTTQRATKIYQTVVDVFNWRHSSECVTPLELARKQFFEVETPGKVCIPGAGIGTYVLAAIEAGFRPSDITAVELNPSYFEMGEAIYQRFGVNYVLADFLTWQPDMQFDVIVGNPPYQAPKNKNGAKMPPLWKKFIEKSAEILSPGGFLSLLVPSQVAKFHEEGKPSPALQKVKSLAVTEIETGIESYFNVGSEICRIDFVKGPQADTVIFNGNPWNWGQTPWVPVRHVPEQVELLLKLFEVEGRFTFTLQSHSKPLSVVPELTLGCWGMNRGKHYGCIPLETLTKRKVHLMCATFETSELRDKAIVLLNSPVYAFIRQMTMFGSDVSFKTLSALPIPANWHNTQGPEDVADLFKLTDNEKQILSQFV